MTFEDKRYDEAAAAYRQLYDVTTTVAGREDAMKGYVRATLAGGDAAKIEAMAADVARIPTPGPSRCASRNSHGPSCCVGRTAAPMP